MISRRVALGTAGAVLLGAAVPEAWAQSDPAADRIRSFYDTIERTMRNAGALGPRGRFEALSPALQRAFDIGAMTRIAVGSSWSSIPGGRQAALQRAFSRFLIATYAKRLDGYSGERFEVTASEARGGNRLVRSRVVEGGGRVTSIDYLVGSGGRAIDVYLNGSISEMATRRAEFESVLSSSGPEGLEANLNRRTESLLSGA